VRRGYATATGSLDHDIEVGFPVTFQVSGVELDIFFSDR
jgi:hypothetical protein